MGKLLVAGALAVLLGVFVGGVGPRAELRRARAEIAELKAAAARGGGAAALPLALGVGSLVAAQQRARAQTPGPPRFVPADLFTQVDLGAFERLADRVSTMDLPRGPERP
jgi:hypothetical protein